MDSKTCDAVLLKILEMANEKTGRLSQNYDQLELTFNIPKNEAKAAIASWNEQGLIKADFRDSGVMMYVQPIAYGHFSKEKENRNKELKKKWSDRGWSFSIGLISGILLIICQNFFKLPNYIPISQYNKIVNENRILNEKLRQLKSIDISNIKAEITRLEKRKEQLNVELEQQRVFASPMAYYRSENPVKDNKPDPKCIDLENDINKTESIIESLYNSNSKLINTYFP